MCVVMDFFKKFRKRVILFFFENNIVEGVLYKYRSVSNFGGLLGFRRILVYF